eukprot:1392094-Rhodomonas_salina.7
MSGPDIQYRPMRLLRAVRYWHIWYTDVACGPTRVLRDVRYSRSVWAYARATRCPVLTKHARLRDPLVRRDLRWPAREVTYRYPPTRVLRDVRY